MAEIHRKDLLTSHDYKLSVCRRNGKKRAGGASADHPAEDGSNDEDDEEKKKDKKLVFLSRSVLQKVRERPMVTGTQIANEILEMYKKFCDVSLTHALG